MICSGASPRSSRWRTPSRTEDNQPSQIGRNECSSYLSTSFLTDLKESQALTAGSSLRVNDIKSSKSSISTWDANESLFFETLKSDGGIIVLSEIWDARTRYCYWEV